MFIIMCLIVTNGYGYAFLCLTLKFLSSFLSGTLNTFFSFRS
jgi:hypothetical protein